MVAGRPGRTLLPERLDTEPHRDRSPPDRARPAHRALGSSIDQLVEPADDRDVVIQPHRDEARRWCPTWLRLPGRDICGRGRSFRSYLATGVAPSGADDEVLTRDRRAVAGLERCELRGHRISCGRAAQLCISSTSLLVGDPASMSALTSLTTTGRGRQRAQAAPTTFRNSSINLDAVVALPSRSAPASFSATVPNRTCPHSVESTRMITSAAKAEPRRADRPLSSHSTQYAVNPPRWTRSSTRAPLDAWPHWVIARHRYHRLHGGIRGQTPPGLGA